MGIIKLVVGGMGVASFAMTPCGTLYTRLQGQLLLLQGEKFLPLFQVLAVAQQTFTSTSGIVAVQPLVEDRKMVAHAEACRSVGITFTPLVVETIGGWSVNVVDTIKSIGRLQGKRLDIPPSDSTCAIILWRGNAGIWIHCSPSDRLSGRYCLNSHQTD